MRGILTRYALRMTVENRKVRGFLMLIYAKNKPTL